MRYNISIDQLKSIEWNLNTNQAALFSILTQLNNWANEIIIENEVYYHCSRNMIINEIPLFFSKPDTVYRAIIKLSELNLIQYKKLGNKDLIKLTDKGKEWNKKEFSEKLGNKSEYSEIDPKKLGNRSEKQPKNSEIDPTYNNTSNHIKKNIIEKSKFSQTVLYVYDQIIDFFPERLQPQTTKTANEWKNEIRKLIDLDNRNSDEIINLIEWVRNDKFWKPKLQSPQKLRLKNQFGQKYYDVFLDHMQSDSEVKKERKSKPLPSNKDVYKDTDGDYEFTIEPRP